MEELAVQHTISCDKTVGGCSVGDLPTAIDHMQNTAGDIASDSEEGLAHVGGIEAKWLL